MLVSPDYSASSVNGHARSARGSDKTHTRCILGENSEIDKRSAMTSSGNVHSIDVLIGRAVLSRTTANKLGQIHDILVDPAKGEMIGLSVRMLDESLRLVDYQEIFSFGPDAVMINGDESAIPAEESPLKALPLARNNLIGVKVVTAGGKLVGQIAHVYMRLAETLVLIYEVRSSLLDKLLGNALFFPASMGRALSGDGTRLIIESDATERADHSLEALATRLFGPPKEEAPMVTVRSRGHGGTDAG